MTASPIDLPAGLTARPLRLADAGAATAVIVAEELHDIGVAEMEEADLVADWQQPSVDLSRSTLGVYDGAQLVAYAELPGTFNMAAVLPSYRGRGIGTALARWMQSTARARGTATLGTNVPEGTPGHALLTKLGYRVAYRAWDFGLATRADLAAAAPPPGILLRDADPAEYPALHALIEDAFLEWAERERRSYADWSARFLERPGFEPWQARVAVTSEPSGAGDPSGGDQGAVGAGMVAADGTVVGAAILAAREGRLVSIELLATRKDQRGRGLGSALIADAVEVSAARGATSWSLQTDSRTGAKDLYERLGLRVRSTWVHLRIAID